MEAGGTTVFLDIFVNCRCFPLEEQEIYYISNMGSIFPTRHQPWEYNFYMDFSGHREEKEVGEAIKALEEHAVFVKILGSYPKAR